MRFRALLLAAAVALPASIADAQAPTVTYTVSGSSGNWFLNFNVVNNFTNPSTQAVYFFGTFLTTGTDVTGTPSGWSQWAGGATWNNQAYGYGGSSTPYNNNWIGSGIVPGGSLNGFVAHTTAADAPTSVQWYAFSVGSPDYNGPDSNNGGWNPGFEGVAGVPVTATPEPASLALLATGLAGLGGFTLKRRRKEQAKA